MPTQFDFAQSFTGSPLTVFAMLSQEDFILAKCSATGSLSAEASVAQVPIDGGETVTLISTRVLPAEFVAQLLHPAIKQPQQSPLAVNLPPAFHLLVEKLRR